MKKLQKWFGFVIAIAITVFSGSVYAMADEPALSDRVEEIPGGGHGASGADSPQGGQWHEESRHIAEDVHHDFDYYQSEINKRICEMKLESCPIDQILRSASRSRHADSMIIKYYRIGQRPVTTTLGTAITATSNGVGNEIKPVNPKCFDNMDTILFPSVQGYKADGETRDAYHPLMVRVVGRTTAGYPIVVAINGKRNSDNRFDLPAIDAGVVMLRLGRAAGERDVKTGSYYTMPEPSEQYCQRFIMQVEQSKIEQMLKTVVDWDFIKQERIAVDDMRGGIERSGLFGVKGRISWSDSGEIYTTGGIFWEAGKDLEIGHWQPKMQLDAEGKMVPVTIPTGSMTTETYTVNSQVQSKDNSDNLLFDCEVSGTAKVVYQLPLYDCEVSTTATVVYSLDGGTTWKSNEDDSTVTPDATPTVKANSYIWTDGTAKVTPDATPTAKMETVSETRTRTVAVTQQVYEYVISQKELTAFINQIIQDAGNGSRTKLLFVDNLIYQALANIKTDNRTIFQNETNYRNWNLDFESFSTMGTKILIYRHDSFNYMKMDGMGFCLDPRYLEKWVFGDWDRQEYDLKNLFVRNSDAVVMTEYSGWTLEFPNAHARVSRPTFDTTLGVTDELQAA